MKQKTGRKLLSFLLTLAMIVGLMPGMSVTAGAATKTVTLYANDITDQVGNSFTKDCITFTPGYVSIEEEVFEDGGTFTTASGKFTNIEITANTVNIGGEGWSDGTWTGDASTSVLYFGMIEGLQSIVFTIETADATHSVNITPGNNMTKTTDSGAASQTGLSGAMTPVVYTANEGYYFPENYSVAAVNGISVTCNSYTQITVSGAPTADAAITLTAPTAKTTPAAPTTAAATDCTTADNNDGTLTGVTTEMEYQKQGDTEWTAGTGSDITGLVPGTYYVRIKATDTTLASDNQELTVNAAQTQTEELLTTITGAGSNASTATSANVSYSTEGVATLTFSGAVHYHSSPAWGWWGTNITLTVTPADGYTITKCVFYDNIDNNATDSEAPFVVETAEDNKMPKVNGSYIYPYSTSAGVKKIEVYGYATPTPALDPVSYMAWNGTTLVEKTDDDACTDYTVVTADTTTFEDGKWYVVSNSVTVSNRITAAGTANLILCDGATLTASKGITVNSGNTINIYAQIGGTGELNAGSDTSVASIGGGARYQSSGTVNIHGGKITATGGSNASGIGGATDGGNGEVNIYSGEVTARGKNYAAGIGGYSNKSGGTVNIYGGTVNASGSEYGTTGIGIGGIKPGSCVVHIYGGEVTATSEKAAAGIQGTVTIDGGTVMATGGVSDSISSFGEETYSSNGINGTVTVNGGTVTAFGGNITGGYAAIESYGGTIYACSGINGTVTISGGTVTAIGGNVTGDINNSGGTIYACNGVNGTVTISGGTVTATGGSHTGNSSGTTVKEKGFGGSLTLGTGMYLYGGTSANPESDLSNYRAGAGDYNGDRYVYMTVNNVVPHIHSFTYTATDATITAACTAGCDITEGLALTISAPTELTYDGSAKAATLSTGYNTTAFPGEYVIKYYKGANEVEAANVKAAGDYTAKVTVGEATASVDFTIAKATITITPHDKTGKYGETIKELTFTQTGTIYGEDNLNITLSTTATDTSAVGVYPITAGYTENANYNVTVNEGKYTITKTDLNVVASAYSGVYDGEAHSITVDVDEQQGTVYYATEKLKEDNYKTAGSTTAPTRTDVGTTTVYYYVESANYEPNPIAGSKDIVITKAAPAVTAPISRTLTYTGEAQALITAGSTEDGTIVYSLDGEIYAETIPTGINAGEYTTYYKVIGDKNHKDSQAATVVVSIGKAAMENKTVADAVEVISAGVKDETIDLKECLQDGAKVEKAEKSGELADYITAGGLRDGIFTYSVAENAGGINGTLTLTVSSTNYKDYNITINLVSAKKITEVVVESEDVKETAVEVVEVPALEDFTEAQPEATVEVKMDVKLESEETVEKEIGTTALEDIKDTVTKAFGGVDSSALSQEYLDITVTKSVDGGTPQAIADVNRVLEIAVGYDLTGKYNPVVIREHGGAVSQFTKINSRPTAGSYKDGTFFVEGSGTSGKIYIYARYFSTYTVAYTTTASYQVTFDDATGDAKQDSNVTQVVVATGTKVAKPADPKRDGYDFDGWFISGTDTKWNFDTAVTSDVTLVAHWDEEDDDDDEVVATPASVVTAAPRSPKTSDALPGYAFWLILAAAGLAVSTVSAKGRRKEQE